MEKSEMVSLELNQDMVKSVLDKQIQAAIVSQLGSQDDLIAKAVSMALNNKVDRHGNKSRYDSDNKYDFLEQLANNQIQKAATDGVGEWLKDNSSKIKDAVLKEMKKPNRQRSMATSFANAIEESIQCSWNMQCNIHFTEKDVE